MVKKFFHWKVLFAAIILIATFFRFWQLDKIPTGISNDELQFLINAKSVFLNGKDISGNWFPFFLPPGSEFPQAELPHILMAPFVGLMPFSLLFSKTPYAAISVLQVVLLFLIVRKLIGKNEGLTVALVAALNPWSIFFGRTAYEAPLAVFFYLLALYLLLKLRGWKILVAFLPLLIGFYCYMGTKLILLPFVLIISAYSWHEVNKDKYLKQYANLINLCLVLLFVFVITVKLQSTSLRLSELSTPNGPQIAAGVNEERRLSIHTPLTPFFSNKLAVWSKDSISKFLKVYSTELLFVTGEGRGTFSLWFHGYFYYLDFIFLLLGFIILFVKKRSVWLLITGLILIAPIPTVASNSQTGFAALRSALIFPLFIILIGLGLWYMYSFIKNTRYKIAVFCIIGALYILQIGNFTNIYYFRNPIYNPEAYNLSARIVSKYITLAQKKGINMLVLTDDPENNFKHYLFDTNSFTAQNASQVESMFKTKVFAMANVQFVRCATGLPLPAGYTIITDNSPLCKAMRIVQAKNHLIIPQLSDGGAILHIYADSLCAHYSMGSYPYNFFLSDFSVESLSAQRFCEKFIIKPNTM